MRCSGALSSPSSASERLDLLPSHLLLYHLPQAVPLQPCRFKYSRAFLQWALQVQNVSFGTSPRCRSLCRLSALVERPLHRMQTRTPERTHAAREIAAQPSLLLPLAVVRVCISSQTTAPAQMREGMFGLSSTLSLTIRCRVLSRSGI